MCRVGAGKKGNPMCDTCGCGQEEAGLGGTESRASGHPRAHAHEQGHEHSHGREQDHEHSHGHVRALEALLPRSIRVETDVLAKNDRIAQTNRDWFEARSILALNLMSSPGAGKTTLLEMTLRQLAGSWHWAVIEGDQQTDNDARRIAACGVPVTQINTGTMCHLDAGMVQDACRRLDSPTGAVVLIENVGNLVCPAMFDLGEAAKVVIASVTEGDDKPAKYPYMFKAAGLVILNKTDLLPYVRFDTARFEQLVRQVNPDAPVLPLSATTGAGLDAWHGWLRGRRSAIMKHGQVMPAAAARHTTTR